MDNKQTGALISRLRKAKNMTQKELAEKLAVTDKAVSKWERGLGYPDISILPLLASILGVTVEEILSGDEIKTVKTMPNRFLTGDFFKSKLVKAIIFIQIGLTILVALTALVSLLYAKEMGSEAIWQTLKGLFAVWFMCISIFGFLPLFAAALIYYLRHK
ncbi:MAG: helix-turn-helix domain-containing protein [Lachnospiraceae bacterium]|nr:helix-turn-helix domain-containing protein [Lachnospiraceae bacterium]